MTTGPQHPHAGRVTFSVTVVIAMLSMIGPFSIDTPFPAFPAMAEAFRADAEQMQLVVTVYMAAFAVMSIFHGPVSDSIGRRPVMIGSCAVYAVASVGAAFSPNLSVLLLFRALQGLSAGGSTIVARTVIRDLYDGAQAQRLMSRVVTIFSVAPAIAPVIGGVLLQVGTWRLEFWFMALLALVLIASVLLVLPETHPEHLRTPVRVGAIVQSLVAVFRLPAFHRVTWAMTLTFGGQFLYIGGAAIFVGNLLGQGELDYWKLFAPMVGCLMLGSVVSGRLAGTVTPQDLVTGGLVFSTVVSVLGIGVAALGGATLPWAIICPSLIAFGVGIAFPNQNLILLDLFPTHRGAVMSGATFVTLLFNAVAAATLAPWAGRTISGLAAAAAVMVVLGLLVWLSHVRATARLAAADRA